MKRNIFTPNQVSFLNVYEIALFKPHKQNRLLDKRHINKLKESLLECPINPIIIVNPNTNTLLDGTHKHAAAMELINEGLLPKNYGFYVQFAPMSEKEEIKWIIELNNNTKGWTTDDYVHSYIQVNPSYALLEKFCSEHLLCHNNKKNIYRYGASMMLGKNVYSCLKKGQFEVTEEDYAFGHLFHDEILALIYVLEKDVFGDMYANISTPWNKVREKHNISQWLKSAKKCKNRIKTLPSKTKTEWENIFDIISSNVK
jgi:hypothetical protein